MAKKAKLKKVAPTEVDVYFHPDPHSIPIQMVFDLPPLGDPDGSICNCNHDKLDFSYFHNSIEPGLSYCAVPMVIPKYFETPEKSRKTLKSDVRKLFLLRTSESAGSWQKRKSAFADFFGDIRAKGTGPHGCPIRVLMKVDSFYEKKIGKTVVKFSNDFFTFNDMRFYPFLLREYIVAYFVCDESATHRHWKAFDPNEKGISLNYPLTYDATLGLFVTRDASIVGP